MGLKNRDLQKAHLMSILSVQYVSNFNFLSLFGAVIGEEQFFFQGPEGKILISPLLIDPKKLIFSYVV